MQSSPSSSVSPGTSGSTSPAGRKPFSTKPLNITTSFTMDASKDEDGYKIVATVTDKISRHIAMARE